MSPITTKKTRKYFLQVKFLENVIKYPKKLVSTFVVETCWDGDLVQRKRTIVIGVKKKHIQKVNLRSKLVHF